MLNRVVLIGRLTKDPELRYTPAGDGVSTFTLAVERPFKNQQGNKDADFINIVTWRKLAEVCANYLRKGRLAAVEGRIQVRNYENNEGKRVYVTEVVADNVQFLESAGAGGNREDNSSDQNRSSEKSRGNQSNQDPFSGDGKPIDISDDDLPF